MNVSKRKRNERVGTGYNGHVYTIEEVCDESKKDRAEFYIEYFIVMLIFAAGMLFVGLLVGLVNIVKAEEYDQHGGIAQMQHYASVTALIAPTVNHETLRVLVAGYEPETSQPAKNQSLESTPAPDVINDDKGARVSEVAPPPTFTDQPANPPCIGPLCNIQTPAVGLDLTPETNFPLLNVVTEAPPTQDAPPPAKRFIFPTKEIAAQNRYACREGIAIWGQMIKELEPTFEPILTLADIAPENPFICANGFEVYPDSQLCSDFPDQESIEVDYGFCATTNFQYWDKLAKLRNIPTVPEIEDCESEISFGGVNVWKGVSENTKAPVVILAKSLCGRLTNTRIEDALGAILDNGRPRYTAGCGTPNQGRYHEDFLSLQGNSREGFFRFDLDGRPQCIRIPQLNRDVRS